MIRGGTSRGAYFLRDDLPDDPVARDSVLVQAMGGPDPLQIDGIGGGHPLTSKVAVISVASDVDVDIDYLFLQIDPVGQTVSDVQNCGNILAGVGLYALAEGLVETKDPVSIVRVRMQNTGALCDLEIPSPGGIVQVEGDTKIDGVPGTGAAIVCNYLDIAGSACGALLPTGNAVDEIDGIRVTCIDNGMPVVTILAEDLGITGYERPEDLDQHETLKARLETIRLQAGPTMNLGDVKEKSVPKMCLVSPAQQSGLVMTRTFIPHVCHKTIGVLGAVSTATACLLPDSCVASVANSSFGNPRLVTVEHADGSMQVQLDINQAGDVVRAGIVRTGRILFKGEIYI